MPGGSSYIERAPSPALGALAWSVWVQRVGDAPVAQRHVPHGGGEVRCLLGEAPRLLGPLRAAVHRPIPAGGTVIGVRLRPGAVSAVVGMPADEVVDQDLVGSELWPDQARLTDALGTAGTAWEALERLQDFLARSAGSTDPLAGALVEHLMPWRGSATLPAFPLSERQLRRRCRAAVGVGPKELQRILRFQGFVARVQAWADRGGEARVDLSRWAGETGYHDQAHLGRECRRLMAASPGEVLAQYHAACVGADHQHAASYRPMLPPGDGRSVQERRSDRA